MATYYIGSLFIKFKSTNHGLNSDFIKMFDYTMSNFNINFEKETIMDIPKEVIFKTSDYKYVIQKWKSYNENIVKEYSFINTNTVLKLLSTVFIFRYILIKSF